MADNRRFGFKNMGHMGIHGGKMNASGFRGQDGQASPYDAGVETAVQIHQQGGIQALLEYLASLA